MILSVEFTVSAARELKKLPKDVQQRLLPAIERLAQNPFPPGMKKLLSEDNIYRIRVGDYRVLYQVQTAKLVVLVLKVGHRREVYR